MKNTIAARIADFLKNFPPFDLLQQEQLYTLASEVKVVYVEKGRSIFKAGEEQHQYFYVVNKGAVSVLKPQNDIFETIDKCDEGDIFGLRPLFAKENYLLETLAVEESILYGIPIDIFKPIAENHPRVREFLLQSFASNTRNPYASGDKGKLLTSTPPVVAAQNLFELQPAPITRKVITISPATTVQKAAQKMKSRMVGSLVVVEDNIPVGIVTDENFRDLVANEMALEAVPVSEIMSSPVICYSKGITISQAQLTMMKHGIDHICITEDGTPNSQVIGILSAHNIMLSEGNNPSILMKAIQRSNSTNELKKIRNKITLLLRGYLESNIPLNLISKIIFELNDASIKRIVERCIKKMPAPPPAEFAWLSLGSQGRKEQLLQTDQDNAIIFADVAPEHHAATKAYFLELAKKVNKRLSIIGYEYCPVNTMAKNEQWCKSLSEWKEQVALWITNAGNDELLLSSIFFDFDISYGNVKLSNALSDHIFELTRNNRRFTSALAAVTLRNPPPLGFFRQFVVEHDGENKDTFDIKKRAITPLTDAGRLLILSHEVKNLSNTSERFDKLAQLEPSNSELYLACSFASKALLKFRTKQGIKERNNGRFIKLEELSKEEKMKLKRCFRSLKEVQDLVKIRFEISGYHV
ncbi:DUF294 nucleotidyltransferase-like domain-containing protein [Salinimicrobium sp. TIG7-5_MAKvit]|uniref:DUF294 nucleotidyltransferase-like domain-containing protein n=1 Tax=Salinimicrobium sp. TIG7-5_MAKvit TaxID=3121289 RepID=UPI003C6E237D